MVRGAALGAGSEGAAAAAGAGAASPLTWGASSCCAGAGASCAAAAWAFAASAQFEGVDDDVSAAVVASATGLPQTPVGVGAGTNDEGVTELTSLAPLTCVCAADATAAAAPRGTPFTPTAPPRPPRPPLAPPRPPRTPSKPPRPLAANPPREGREATGTDGAVAAFSTFLSFLVLTAPHCCARPSDIRTMATSTSPLASLIAKSTSSSVQSGKSSFAVASLSEYFARSWRTSSDSSRSRVGAGTTAETPPRPRRGRPVPRAGVDIVGL
ncbi:hypothetical protein AAT19DRAFT_11657 [Rhodotorula toruloides]|uniref:Uncharacterized protein n=1 Tax=Rhodotorula toruloides TaxID=5286 RepID=A0A2S9ZW81_RHOTO|nr:hypothetical protein AAT19DRAFT_11657 [Rhodotorula toruloides]